MGREGKPMMEIEEDSQINDSNIESMLVSKQLEVQ